MGDLYTQCEIYILTCARVDIHKYCTHIYSHQVYIALQVMKTSMYCHIVIHKSVYTAMHAYMVITDIIKLRGGSRDFPE